MEICVKILQLVLCIVLCFEVMIMKLGIPLHQPLGLNRKSKYWKVVSLSEISLFVFVFDANIRYSSSIFGKGVTLKIKRYGV